jgi:hypothetical protein
MFSRRSGGDIAWALRERKGREMTFPLSATTAVLPAWRLPDIRRPRLAGRPGARGRRNKTGRCLADHWINSVHLPDVRHRRHYARDQSHPLADETHGGYRTEKVAELVAARSLKCWQEDDVDRVKLFVLLLAQEALATGADQSSTAFLGQFCGFRMGGLEACSRVVREETGFLSWATVMSHCFHRMFLQLQDGGRESTPHLYPAT